MFLKCFFRCVGDRCAKLEIENLTRYSSNTVTKKFSRKRSENIGPVGCVGPTFWFHGKHQYEVLLKSSRNWNAARKPFVEQLCVAMYHELYPLWIILPSGVLLWGHVCCFSAFLWLCVSAVLRSYRPAKMTVVKEQRICIKFCFKLGNGFVKAQNTWRSIWW